MTCRISPATYGDLTVLCISHPIYRLKCAAVEETEHFGAAERAALEKELRLLDLQHIQFVEATKLQESSLKRELAALEDKQKKSASGPAARNDVTDQEAIANLRLLIEKKNALTAVYKERLERTQQMHAARMDKQDRQTALQKERAQRLIESLQSLIEWKYAGFFLNQGSLEALEKRVKSIYAIIATEVKLPNSHEETIVPHPTEGTMSSTKLCYFRDSKTTNGVGKITEVIPGASPKEAVLRLDQTVFYPKGGGQPSDKGTINNKQLKFEVSSVAASAIHEGQVDHIGTITDGAARIGEEVEMQVDQKLRVLHNRLHSGGHVVDAALAVLGMDYLTATKAYHYPDGPYVQYAGELKISKEEFIKVIQEECNRLVAKDLPVFIDFANDDASDTKCERKMRIGDIMSIACGGTHVDSLGQIGKVTIRKVESKKGTTKVAYQISD